MTGTMADPYTAATLTNGPTYAWTPQIDLLVSDIEPEVMFNFGPMSWLIQVYGDAGGHPADPSTMLFLAPRGPSTMPRLFSGGATYWLSLQALGPPSGFIAFTTYQGTVDKYDIDPVAPTPKFSGPTASNPVILNITSVCP